MAILLFIFSMGIAYDPCVQEDFGISLSEASLSGSSSDASPITEGNCHCLCHFSFSPEPILALGSSEPNHAIFPSFKPFPIETYVASVLRPPIFLI